MTEILGLLKELIARKSITPEDAGCQNILIEQLEPYGFKAEQLNFFEVNNIWLKRGQREPLFVFLGHTDVVPTGPLEHWDSPPFEPTIRDGRLYGRGAADMKGGIACFVAAVKRFIDRYPEHHGAIALMITSDEEGPAVNGIVKVIEVLEQRQEKIAWCLVGEPSSDRRLADVIRIGRRGSLCATLTIHGTQGHVAYPDIADNPIHRFAPALKALTEKVWDQGNEFFPPTRLQISNIHAGTGAENVIPGVLSVQFNLRFSTELTDQLIQQQTIELLDQFNFQYDLHWRLSGQPFLTQSGALIDAAHRAIEQVTGHHVIDSTAGGTSDGRFIAPTGAQVIELGLLNESIHKINENIVIDDLDILSEIYEKILIELLVK